MTAGMQISRMSARSRSWLRFGEGKLKQDVLVFSIPDGGAASMSVAAASLEKGRRKKERCGHLGARAFEADGTQCADGARGWAESDAKRASMCVCLWKTVGLWLWRAERRVPPVRP
jgi:hypothetical protein